MVLQLVGIREKTKKVLDSLKIHPRETYDDVLTRILDDLKKLKQGEDKKDN